ncbi:hypothetical protein PCE31106_00005 [Pandoraea cepalis]|uniref:Uncharacterized protein n=1 Tax=Pandoraea cepalis TaxID=2508294 RepID=A0A5E4R7Q0_9BURK|nr:hypothetical protein PCE31106_00005 [Pandoraea cepalis]
MATSPREPARLPIPPPVLSSVSASIETVAPLSCPPNVFEIVEALRATRPLPVIAPAPLTTRVPPRIVALPVPRLPMRPRVLSMDATCTASVLSSPSAPDWIRPFVLSRAPPPMTDREASERATPCVLLTSPDTFAVALPLAASMPAELSRLPTFSVSCPPAMISPPAFSSVPAPLPGAIVSRPVPEASILPPLLLRRAGASVRSWA